VGKSFTVHHLTEKLRNEGRVVGITATTGTAALNVGGMTVHRYEWQVRCTC
jgi:uncharacterized NAD-dependent epimerase/dehydratase family protein